MGAGLGEGGGDCAAQAAARADTIAVLPDKLRMASSR
jgi:hypothetical protein